MTIRGFVGLASLLCLSGLMVFSDAAFAHGGGLNSQGCHNERRTGGYHCHRSQDEMVGNRLRCDLGSRSRECGNQGNAAAVNSTTVMAYQRQLMRHCSSLSSGFVDGRNGPATRAALVRFQRSYDLVADGTYGPSTAAALAGPVTGACR